MEIKNEYLRDLYRRVEKRDPNEPEFLQAVGEVLQSLAPVADPVPTSSTGVFLSALLSRSA